MEPKPHNAFSGVLEGTLHLTVAYNTSHVIQRHEEQPPSSPPDEFP